MIEQIRQDFSTTYPPEIVDAILDSFIEIKENYYLGRHEPAELNGGKFVEATVRLLQYVLRGNFTPIGESIRNMLQELRNFEQTPSTHPETFRLNVPRILIGMYNIRNRRGVGHLGGDVNPNLADSTLILSVASWVLAELYRTHYSVSISEAQKIVDDLVERKIPLVYEIGELKRVLSTKLSAKDQTLLFLSSSHPDPISESDLLRFTEYSNASNYRNKILRVLHRQRFIEYNETGSCKILPPGLRYVERNYDDWLESMQF